MKSPVLTSARLREVLAYDPVNGVFYWINPPKFHPRLNAEIAGCDGSGYLTIKIDGHRYKAHRPAWLYVHGEWPNGDVDHANGQPLDNRIANLRIATNSQNQANRPRNSGKVTPKGVRLLPSGNFEARICVNKQLLNLGTFASAELAQSAYAAAALQHYGQFARAA